MSTNIRIVLVRPRDPNNIGAVARAMKNFGFSDLWVVSPLASTWGEVKAAVNATDVLANARIVETLAEAVADCNLVVGTGDRTRTGATEPLYTPVELTRSLQQASYELALVFGNEKHGMTNEELSHCHRLMTIPTQPNCPSMNLGQSVAVCLYEFVREQTEPAPPAAEQPNAGETEALVRHAMEVLEFSDFVLPGNLPHLQQRVRAGLMKYELTKYDTIMLCGILRKIKTNYSLLEKNEAKARDTEHGHKLSFS
jgi:TrmH family RNA methyltransferase